MSMHQANQRFYFVYGNHGPAPSQLEDYYFLLRDLLQYSLGVDLLVSQDPVAGHWNFVTEMFDERDVNLLKFVQKQNPRTRLICIATEFVTGKTFNDFENGNQSRESFTTMAARCIDRFAKTVFPASFRAQCLKTVPFFYLPAREVYYLFGGEESGARIATHYSDQAYWEKRYECFHQLIDYFHQVWYVSPQQREGYVSVINPEKLWLMPIIPYTDRLVDQETDLCDQNKDLDFLFTGTITWHRERLLGKLEGAGHRVATGPANLPSFIRDQYLRRTKICLHVKLYPEWRFASTMRLHVLLMQSKFVIAERSEDQPIQCKYVQEVETENFVEQCLSNFQAGGLSQKGIEARNAYVLGTADDRVATKVKIQSMFTSLGLHIDEAGQLSSLEKAARVAATGAASVRGRQVNSSHQN